MTSTVQVTFDCANPDRLARFWAEALHYKLQDPPEGFDTWEDWLRQNNLPEEQWDSASAIVDPDGKGPRFYFQRVPEPKTGKNRLHLDVEPGVRGLPAEERKEKLEAEASRLEGLGASILYRQE